MQADVNISPPFLWKCDRRTYVTASPAPMPQRALSRARYPAADSIFRSFPNPDRERTRVTIYGARMPFRCRYNKYTAAWETSYKVLSVYVPSIGYTAAYSQSQSRIHIRRLSTRSVKRPSGCVPSLLAGIPSSTQPLIQTDGFVMISRNLQNRLLRKWRRVPGRPDWRTLGSFLFRMPR